MMEEHYSSSNETQSCCDSLLSGVSDAKSNMEC